VRETPRIEMGHSREVVDITRKGQFRFSTWQGISLVHCDGPREREIVADLR
jgi:thiamine phosphate synthase YjbQ (UPF0047 family)